MEDDDPEDLYSLQEVAEESKDRPPLEVVDLTAETKVPTDRVEDKPALENTEPVRNILKIPLFSPNFS